MGLTSKKSKKLYFFSIEGEIVRLFERSGGYAYRFVCSILRSPVHGEFTVNIWPTHGVHEREH